MSDAITENLASFSPKDTTVRVLNGLLGVLPQVEPFQLYTSWEQARDIVAPGLDAQGLEHARSWAAGPEGQKALKVAQAIDVGDAGISVFTGLQSAFNLFFGDKKKALESDTQQGADAALKAAAIAWMAHTLFTGTPAEKVAQLRATPSGQALLAYYAAIEVAMPFADDVAKGAGGVIDSLLTKHGSTLSRLDAAAGAGASAASKGMLDEIKATLVSWTATASEKAGPIAQKAQEVLPRAVATADKVAGTVATAADALPVYKLLGTRLVVEAALLRAKG